MPAPFHRLFPLVVGLTILAVLALPASAGLPRTKGDQNRIINASMSFLKNREPEMTGAEYALYQKVLAMAKIEPALAMQLLEGMVSGKEQPSAAFELMIGNLHYIDGRMAEAERYFRRAIDHYPDFLRAWSNLGALLYSTEKYEAAADCLAKAVELGDVSPDTLGMLAFSLRRTGQPAAAEMAYLRALSADSKCADWIEGLAGLYVGSGQHARAEPLVRQLLRLQPAEPRHWLQLAGVHLQLGRKAEAVVALESARLLHVTNPELLRQLGDLYVQLQLEDDAVAVYAESMKTDPVIGTKRLLVIAQLYGRQGRLAEAFAVLATIAPDLPMELRAGFFSVRAELHFARQDWAAARRDLEVLLAEQPMNGRGWLSLGRVASAQDDLASARRAFDTAARLPESGYLAHLEMANLAVRDHRHSEGIDHLRQALALEDTPSVRAFLVRIERLVAHNENIEE